MKTRSSAIWVVLCLSAVGLGAVSVYVKHAPNVPLRQRQDASPPITGSKSPEPPEETPKAATKVVVYTPTMGNDGISFAKKDADVPDGEDPKTYAVNQFLMASEVVSADTKALDVDVHDDGSAVIDFTKGFNQSYGSFEEKKLLDGLAATLGQFSDVKQFIMTADGTPIKTLGNSDLTDPIPVIRPGDVPASPSFGASSQESTEPPKP